MKRLLSIIIAVVLLVGVSAVQAEAIEGVEASLTITITLQILNVTLTEAVEWAPVVTPQDIESSWVTGSAGNFTATNTGNGDETFLIYIEKDIPNITLAFGHGTPPYTKEPTYIKFNMTGKELAKRVGPTAPNNTDVFDLQVTTSDFQEATIDVVVIVIAIPAP